MADTKQEQKKPEAKPTYRRLYRSCDDRMVAGVAGGLAAGVAGGLAEYFEVDPALVRLLVLLLVFTGAGFFFYLLAWIVVPENPNCLVHEHVPVEEDLGKRAEQFAGEVKQTMERNSQYFGHSQVRDSRRVGGLILVGLGMLFLLQTWFNFEMGRLWPVILIVIGVSILAGRGSRR
jgi:phage shock protein C